MKALLCEASGRTRLTDVPVPALRAGEALVATEVCGLCGSDLLKLNPSAHSKPGPLGHEVAGRVAALGRGVRGFKVGDRVVVAHHVPCYECHYCRRGSVSMCRDFKRTNLDPGGFAEFVRVSAGHVKHTMLRLPPRVGFAEATLVEPIACAVRNLRRLDPQKGDTVVVIGLGFIGLIMSRLLQLKGARVVGLEIDPARIRIARTLGVPRAFPGWGPAAKAAVAKLSEGRGADSVVFTAGPVALVGESLSWLRDGGTVNVFASFSLADPFARVDMNQVYHRELTLLTGYSAEPRDLREALRLLAAKKVDARPFVRWSYRLEEFDEALRRFRSREILKAVFRLRPQGDAR